MGATGSKRARSAVFIKVPSQSCASQSHSLGPGLCDIPANPARTCPFFDEISDSWWKSEPIGLLSVGETGGTDYITAARIRRNNGGRAEQAKEGSAFENPESR